jgi:hypothetical protein
MWDARKLGENFWTSTTPKIETGPSTLEKITITPKVATRARGEVGVEAKIDLCMSFITREIQIVEQEIAQSSWNPRKK